MLRDQERSISHFSRETKGWLDKGGRRERGLDEVRGVGGKGSLTLSAIV